MKIIEIWMNVWFNFLIHVQQAVFRISCFYQILTKFVNFKQNPSDVIKKLLLKIDLSYRVRFWLSPLPKTFKIWQNMIFCCAWIVTDWKLFDKSKAFYYNNTVKPIKSKMIKMILLTLAFLELEISLPHVVWL